MSLTTLQRFELKKFIKSIEKCRRAHTELVSVYIPSGYDLNKIINHLAQEQGTAMNIKSASTRNNVITALEKMIQHLRVIGKTPPNGFAVFSGNIAEREGQQEYKVFSIEPPVPLKTRIYRCDKAFQLEIIADMMEIKEVYGLIVMDKREADIAWLKGKTIVLLTSAKSNVPGKTRAGGQSAHRFERLRDIAAKTFFTKIGMMVNEQFLPNIKNIKGIIIGGPGRTKQEFAEGDFITTDIKKKILALKDLSYTGEFGLQELLDKSEDVLAQEEVADEKKVMRKFFETLAKMPGKVAYGEAEVSEKIRMGLVDTLLLSEALEEDKISAMEETARKFSSKVKIISIETREGVQLREIGKIAAILRYEV